MDNEMHQQFIKDFIQSLQAGSEDSNCCMKSNSRSLSESSLNPNAAEFVPSYMKSSDAEEDEAEPQYQRQEAKASASSSTTLVNNAPDGDGPHLTKDETLARIQRQLFNLMNQLGNPNMPLLQIQFSLVANGQGVNVQFLAPESSKRQLLDKQLCQTASLRLEVNENGSLSSRPGYALARQFLDRMGDALNEKSKEKAPVICPKCTALPKKRSFTEMEIDRQIEDIKAFEKLINEDAGTRYQEAFKQLCQKLGLETRNGDEPMEIDPVPVAIPLAINEIKSDPTENTETHFHEDDLSSYEWDPFMPEFTTMKVYRYSNPDAADAHAKDNKQHPVAGQKSLKEDYEQKTSAPQKSVCPTPNNSSTVYPKLYKVNNHVKWSSSPGARKATTHKDKEKDKDKEIKMQRWRFSSPAVVTSGSGNSAAATTAAAPVATTATATTRAIATAVVAAAKTTAATGLAAKKTIERVHQNGNRIKRSHQFTVQSKTGQSNISNAVSKTAANCRLEPRPQLATSKQQPDHVHVSNKLSKASTLSRTGGVGQAQGTKHSTVTAQRILAPRSTHASQMRQSEVKRRLNLMRGDNDTDVQFNEYLFK
ncbi:uncharacterized protein LOC115562256 isoform X2 [Drosophila navojoa]|uniref:uncharacterized protein LOC115562256 isoform X2 n=1 Tax=Drosophila navojoa TaxID=7232 RepID=UPI0011BFBBBF|nr:uncharacterized protein LOC115562256 isoform X2 [Drosophila navojoa]